MNKQEVMAKRLELSARYPKMKDEFMTVSDDLIVCADILVRCTNKERDLFIGHCDRLLEKREGLNGSCS